MSSNGNLNDNDSFEVKLKNFAFSSQSQLKGFNPLSFNLFGKNVDNSSRNLDSKSLGSVNSYGNFKEFLILEEEALDNYFTNSNGVDSLYHSSAINNGKIYDALISSYSSVNGLNGINGFHSETHERTSPTIFGSLIDKNHLRSKERESFSRTNIKPPILPTFKYTVQNNGHKFAVPAFLFQGAYFFAIDENTFEHAYDRNIQIKLPFNPIAFFEIESQNQNIDEIESSQGYFVSISGQICRINSNFNIESINNSLIINFQVALATSSSGYIVLYSKNPESFVIYSTERNQFAKFHPSDYGVQLDTLEGIVSFNSEVGFLIVATGNGKVNILTIKNDPDEMELESSWVPKLKHLHVSAPIQRNQVYSITPLPILKTISDILTEKTHHFLLVHKNQSNQIVFDIIHIEAFLSRSNNAINSFIIEELSSFDYILDLKILENSIQSHQSQISSFTIRILSEQSISELQISFSYNLAIQYIISKGTDIFLTKNRKEILNQLEKWKMFDDLKRLYPNETKDFNKLLNLLWYLNLTSIITQYITLAPQNELGERKYLLHDVSHVFDWIITKYESINNDSKILVNQLLTQNQRGYTTSERFELIEKISKYIQNLHSILLVLEAISIRPQDINERNNLSIFSGEIERLIDYLRITEWLFIYGFLPASLKTYNYKSLSDDWKIKKKTFTFREYESFKLNTLELRRVPIILPNFVTLLIQNSGNENLEYPPKDISSILSLFVIEDETYLPREKITSKLRYNHLLITYLLYHTQIISENPDFELVSRYVQHFNINEGWQKLACAFFHLDTGLLSFPDIINYLMNAQTPNHTWHENIVQAFFSQNDYLSANLYIDMNPNHIFNPFQKLDCLLSRNLLQDALKLQRIFPNEEIRAALLTEIIKYSIYTKNLLTLFTYHFQPFEEKILKEYLNRHSIDSLVSYYILQNRLEDAVQLINHANSKFTKDSISNALSILPQTQQISLLNIINPQQKQYNDDKNIFEKTPSFSSSAIRGINIESSEMIVESSDYDDIINDQ